MALEESNTPTELIMGELVMSPAPKDSHQSVILPAATCLGKLIPDGTIRVAPTDVHLDFENVVQPDIFWVSDTNEHCHLGEDGYWHGAPDLIIEILSPATAKRDKDEKYHLYERFGVREYWMIDPDAHLIEVYRNQQGYFMRHGVFGPGQDFTSPILNGQKISVSAILGK